MYDNICKFIAETFPEDIATWLLGTPVPLTELSPTELSVEPIRADTLILLQSDDLVLHVEFQTKPDDTLPFRMLDYRVRVYRRFPEKPMKQVVVYLQPTGSPLVRQTAFRLEKTYHEFEVVRLWEQPAEVFLNTPGLLPFAVLGQTDEPERVLGRVAREIESIERSRQRSNLAASTAILAGLKLDREAINQILRREIMQESSFYQQLLEEGRQEGRQEGLQEGRQEERRAIALNLLSSGMSVEQVASLTGLSLEQVQRLSQEPS
jgi:predicted transposase/invertase (TIGR01784 family)